MNSPNIIMLVLVSLLLQLDSAQSVISIHVNKSSDDQNRARGALSAAGTGTITNTNAYYTIPITLGGQAFNVLIDTGKTEFWVVDRFCPDTLCVVPNRVFYQSPNSVDFVDKIKSAYVNYFHKNYEVWGITGKDTFLMGNGESITGQDFIRATKVRQFTTEPIDGILGLAYNPTIKSDTRLTPFERMLNLEQVNERSFSLKLTPTDGTLIFGGTDATLYNGIN